MKTVKIILRQAGNGLFQVERFTNTTQLSIGMLVPVKRVTEWCAMTRVQIEVIGMVKQPETDSEPLELGETQSSRKPSVLA